MKKQNIATVKLGRTLGVATVNVGQTQFRLWFTVAQKHQTDQANQPSQGVQMSEIVLLNCV